jgi:O-antigen/teichoic acid export membrane protein
MFKKLKNNTLFSSAAVYLFSNILSALLPFALLPILTRYLTPTEYGQVAIFQTLLAGLGAFVGLSVEGATSTRYFDTSMNKQEQKIFVGNCFLMLSLSTSIVLIFVVAFRKVLSDWLIIDPQWLILSVFVSSATFVISIRMVQWQVRKQVKLFVVEKVRRY